MQNTIQYILIQVIVSPVPNLADLDLPHPAPARSRCRRSILPSIPDPGLTILLELQLGLQLPDHLKELLLSLLAPRQFNLGYLLHHLQDVQRQTGQEGSNPYLAKEFPENCQCIDGWLMDTGVGFIQTFKVPIVLAMKNTIQLEEQIPDKLFGFTNNKLRLECSPIRLPHISF